MSFSAFLTPVRLLRGDPLESALFLKSEVRCYALTLPGDTRGQHDSGSKRATNFGACARSTNAPLMLRER